MLRKPKMPIAILQQLPDRMLSEAATSALMAAWVGTLQTEVKAHCMPSHSMLQSSAKGRATAVQGGHLEGLAQWQSHLQGKQAAQGGSTS